MHMHLQECQPGSTPRCKVCHAQNVWRAEERVHFFSLIDPCDMHRSQLLPNGLVHDAQMDGEVTEADTPISTTF